jgi:hypothetical protein
MTYRAPELFHVESYCVIDQRTDIWVNESVPPERPSLLSILESGLRAVRAVLL